MFDAITPSRLFERIAEQIERSILDGHLKPGDRLPPERDLAQQFDVSRTAVREAVRTLSEKGLVESQHGRGTFVTDPASRTILQSLGKVVNAHGVDQLVEIREIIEPELAARAALCADEDAISAMREAFLAMEAAGRDATAFIEADLDFHLAIAEAVDNPLILALTDSIVELLREHRLRLFFVHGGPQRGQYHHRQILDAIERHDPDGARNAMREHLVQVVEDSLKSSSGPKFKK
jgi:GntR family transcriptional regulator, transcriptional repressor for pyruvate dehydrogenase complex